MSDPTDGAVLAQILTDHPSLSWRGWWSRWHENNEPAGTLDRVRRETLEPSGLAQFRRAMGFLEAAPRIKSLNRSRTTYNWKHRVEGWHGGYMQPYKDVYTGEGAFIAACIASGVPIKRTSDGRTYAALSERAASMSQAAAT